MQDRRKQFLIKFLRVFGVRDIIWGSMNAEQISGTAIFEFEDPTERQDFIWEINQADLPSESILDLIEYLSQKQMISGDRIIKDIDQISLPFANNNQKNKLFEELFNVEVRMIDNGVKTDSFFIHN